MFEYPDGLHRFKCWPWTIVMGDTESKGVRKDDPDVEDAEAAATIEQMAEGEEKQAAIQKREAAQSNKDVKRKTFMLEPGTILRFNIFRDSLRGAPKGDKVKDKMLPEGHDTIPAFSVVEIEIAIKGWSTFVEVRGNWSFSFS